MKIEVMPVNELRPYPNNARTHSKKQIRQIANSIKTFGFCNPVLIDDAKQIIAGHGRVEAAKLLGIDAVSTCRLSHLSEADKRAYILADNKLAEKAGWDKELLAIELQGLIDLDVEIELTGFEMPEIDLILEDAREANGASSGPEDDVPQYPSGPVVSQAEDLWLLGNHRLLCADARDPTAYESLLEGAKAEFVLTDPPYNVVIDGNVCGLGRIRHRDFAMGCGEMNEAEFIAFLETVFERLAENTVDGSIHQICMDWRHMWEMLAAGRKVYGELKNLCVWNKGNAGMGAIARMSGTMPASARCVPDGWKSWLCIQRSSRSHWSRTRSRIAHVGALLCWMPSAAAALSWLRLSGRVARRGRSSSIRPTSTSGCGVGKPTPERLPCLPRQVKPSRRSRSSAPPSRRLPDQAGTEAGSG